MIKLRNRILVFFRKNTKKPLYYFLHIPKTGGTTFAEILKMQYNNKDILELVPSSWVQNTELLINARIEDIGYFGFKKMTNKDIIKLKQFSKVRQSKIVYGHFPYGAHTHVKRHSRYLAIIRKPETLILSLYHEMFRSEDTFVLSLVRKFKNPEEFASVICNVQTFILSGLLCYQDMLDDKQGALNRAMKNIDNHFDYVGTLETIEESIKSIGTLMQWGDTCQIPHARKGIYDKKDFTEKYKKIVTEKNYLDEHLYQYVVEKFSDKTRKKHKN